jgi:uncharacterized protein YbaR (Trm112 family)
MKLLYCPLCGNKLDKSIETPNGWMNCHECDKNFYVEVQGYEVL